MPSRLYAHRDSLFFTTLPLKNTSYSTESLYLWAEDLAEGHILEIQGRPVGDGCADPGGLGGCRRRAGQRVRHHVRRTWYTHKLVGVL